MNLVFFLFLLFSYLIGSIPTGLILLKTLKGIDPRNYGSGNIGSANIARIAGFKIGLIVFFLDSLKGFIPCVIALYYFKNLDYFLLLPFFSVLGHIFSVFLKFKGGKGVAVAFGTIVPLLPQVAFFLFLTYIIVLILTKISSFSSLIATSLCPILIFIFGLDFSYFIYSLIVFALIFFTHRENIIRLLKGEEMKVMLIF